MELNGQRYTTVQIFNRICFLKIHIVLISSNERPKRKPALVCSVWKFPVIGVYVKGPRVFVYASCQSIG